MSLRSFFSVRRMRYFRSSWCRCGRTRWKMSLKRLSTRCDLLAHVAALGQVQPLADELQQAVQLGLALRHQRGRHVELVGGQRRQVEILLAAGLHDELVHQVVAERQAGDLLQQRLVLRAEDASSRGRRPRCCSPAAGCSADRCRGWSRTRTGPAVPAACGGSAAPGRP